MSKNILAELFSSIKEIMDDSSEKKDTGKNMDFSQQEELDVDEPPENDTGKNIDFGQLEELDVDEPQEKNDTNKNINSILKIPIIRKLYDSLSNIKTNVYRFQLEVFANLSNDNNDETIQNVKNAANNIIVFYDLPENSGISEEEIIKKISFKDLLVKFLISYRKLYVDRFIEKINILKNLENEISKSESLNELNSVEILNKIFST